MCREVLGRKEGTLNPRQAVLELPPPFPSLSVLTRRRALACPAPSPDQHAGCPSRVCLLCTWILLQLI
ncbi:hypothetical protein E2C01_002452 [Portunus trituberculatus]|uniref:Uncharacterized protein n=1 Tax=Portunus trituberculatus TaxID=210409 RepID=A0A5B7CMB1_PORTR|nr:hypothetical protein [Portunus trituberculatus]